jgi:hypothetical protein
MSNFLSDFWRCSVASVVLAGIGAGFLYVALFTFSRILIEPTLFAVLCGACLCAAWILGVVAIHRWP